MFVTFSFYSVLKVAIFSANTSGTFITFEIIPNPENMVLSVWTSFWPIAPMIGAVRM